MRSSWVRNDGSCAVFTPRQFRAVSVLLLLLIFVLDITTNIPIATAYFAVIALTFWSHDRRLPLAVSGASAALVFLSLLFTDKGLPTPYLMTLRTTTSLLMLGSGWFLTKHRELIAASAQRERMLRTIFDSEPACVKLLGPDNILIDMNRGGLAMVEVDSIEALKGQSVLPIVTPPHRAAFAELTRQVFEGKSGSLQFETVGLRGTRRWLETHGAPLRDEAGRVTAMLAVSHDITLRKQAEALLRDSEERLLHAASIVGLGFFEHDHNTNLVYWSDGLRNIVGISGDSVADLAKSFSWSHPDDRDRCAAAVAKAHDPAGDGAMVLAQRVVRPDGEIRHISIRSQTQFVETPEGRAPVRTLGTVFDVTERTAPRNSATRWPCGCSKCRRTSGGPWPVTCTTRSARRYRR